MNSMTGFGRGEASARGGLIRVTIRAVNHRYLDLSIRMPQYMLQHEAALRRQVGSCVSRGRLEIFVDAEMEAETSGARLNRALASAYTKAAREAEEQFGIDPDLSAASLLMVPEMIVTEPGAEQEAQIGQLLGEAAAEALRGLTQARREEGRGLEADMLSRISALEDLAHVLRSRTEQVIDAYRQRLEGRVRILMNGPVPDPDRLAQETALFADRCDITEELVRISSHLSQFRTRAAQSGPVGKHLDFVVQELNREFNTIGSKCQDSAMSAAVIEAKAEIEKIREQIQNVE